MPSIFCVCFFCYNEKTQTYTREKNHPKTYYFINAHPKMSVLYVKHMTFWFKNSQNNKKGCVVHIITI